MMDLVFPQGNEKRLVEMARTLGVTELVLCYPLDDPSLKELKREVDRLTSDGMVTTFGVLVRSKADVDKARRITPHLVALGKIELWEDKRVRYILDFETLERRDGMHSRKAGITQVHVNHAIRTGKTILVDAHQILFPGPIPAEVVLGRILQNNTLYRKYRPEVVVVSGASAALEMRSPVDLQRLLDL